MKTMTLNLPEREMEFVEEVAKHNDMSKTAVIRQAIRVYQLVKVKNLEEGIFAMLQAELPPMMAPLFEDANGKP